MLPFSSAATQPGSGSRALIGKEKSDEVTRLMRRLHENLKRENLTFAQQKAALEQLRVLGRDPRNADSIFCKAGVSMLAEYGFDSSSVETSQEALRCIANTLLLAPKLRQVFVDLGYASKAAERLKVQDTGDEFLISRILFLTTYDCNVNFDLLFENDALGESINAHIARHTKDITEAGPNSKSSDSDAAALSESLKLLFNVLKFYPHRAPIFTPSLDNIFQLLKRISIPNPPLQAPINYLINALLNLDLDDVGLKITFPGSDQNCNIERLVHILDRAVTVYKPDQLETFAVPLLTVIRKIYGLAPEGPQKCLKSLLLPSEKDRDLPIGKANSVSSRLLQLSTSPVAPTLREGISSLMFELSGKDANEFVRNVGYGFAAGFLMSHNIPVPSSATETDMTGQESHSIPINPITGQRLDKEPIDIGPEMSDEEKQREAEKLFVLFERLRATGVVDVRNPLTQAVEDGRLDNRFQEVDDSD